MSIIVFAAIFIILWDICYLLPVHAGDALMMVLGGIALGLVISRISDRLSS